jgi:hypothetical protein
MEDLRLDEDFLHEELNVQLLIDYMGSFRNKALDRRVQQLFKTYEL